MEGCVGVIRGYLLQIKIPAVKEVGNVDSFLLGNYAHYGINVQAACYHQCWFIEEEVVAMDGCNGIWAYGMLSLSPRISNLPIGKYVLGNNAYTCSKHLLTPFAGHKK
jgi:hypothetical protein